jgi:hypothetical protein
MEREGEMYCSEEGLRSNEEGGVVGSEELWSWAASPEGSVTLARADGGTCSLRSDAVPKFFWNEANPNIGGIF